MSRALTILTSCAISIILLHFIFLSVLAGAEGTDAEQHEAIMTYLNGPLFMHNTLTFLPDAEREHMSDVKLLFDIDFILFLFAVGALLGIVGIMTYHRMWKRMEELLGRSLRATGVTLLVMCFIFGLSAVINFDVFWTLFHVFLFPQGNWLFSPDSVLIQLYPAEFFKAFVLSFSIRVLAVGIATTLIGVFIMNMQRHEAFFKRKAQKARKNRSKR